MRERIGGRTATHSSLSEIRPKITVIDAEVTRLFSERAVLVQEAALFKRDAGENAAPMQQQTNVDNAVRAAEAYDQRIPGFSEVVRKIYQVVVPAFVDFQRQEIERTFLIAEGTQLEPEMWDFGDLAFWQRATGDPNIFKVDSSVK